MQNILKSLFVTFACLYHYNAVKLPLSLNESTKDLCAPKKCPSSELCIPMNKKNAECISKRLLEFHRISKRSIVANDQNGYCGTNECRFGECEVLNTTIFICHCYKGITGSKCNILDKTQLPCSSNPCYSNSVCINLGDKFACVCDRDKAGPTCRDHQKPCKCQNGGVCVEEIKDLFRCTCPAGFGGDLCQYEIYSNQSCKVLGCLNEGVCTISNKCKCQINFTGTRCETLNATSTTLRPTETVANPKLINSRNLCVLGICQNGGTCVQVESNSAMCICTKGFSGPFCTLLSNVTNQNKQKLTGKSRLAEVVSSVTETSSTTAATTTSLCANLQCFNGGKCVNSKCECPTGFGGDYCNVALTCDQNPCRNNQPCLEINGAAKCFCTADYLEPFCDSKL